jgi:hypothetical protein
MLPLFSVPFKEFVLPSFPQEAGKNMTTSYYAKSPFGATARDDPPNHTNEHEPYILREFSCDFVDRT